MFGKQVTLGLCLITSAEIAHKGNRTDTGHLGSGEMHPIVYDSRSKPRRC